MITSVKCCSTLKCFCFYFGSSVLFSLSLSLALSLPLSIPRLRSREGRLQAGGGASSPHFSSSDCAPRKLHDDLSSG